MTKLGRCTKKNLDKSLAWRTFSDFSDVYQHVRDAEESVEHGKGRNILEMLRTVDGVCAGMDNKVRHRTLMTVCCTEPILTVPMAVTVSKLK